MFKPIVTRSEYLSHTLETINTVRTEADKGILRPGAEDLTSYTNHKRTGLIFVTNVFNDTFRDEVQNDNKGKIILKKTSEFRLTMWRYIETVRRLLLSSSSPTSGTKAIHNV